MVKFYENSHSHAYPFPTVTLAYFLRYPNPYSTHVLCTDVIDRHFDPETQRLYTARLHLKRSKIPSAVLKLLPRAWLGLNPQSSDESQKSYILEKSVVDVRTGVMVTESRNLEFTGVLAVFERQVYHRPGFDVQQYVSRTLQETPFRQGWRLYVPQVHARSSMWRKAAEEEDVPAGDAENATKVATKVELISQLGERRKAWQQKRAAASSMSKEPVTTALPVASSEEELADDDDDEEAPSAAPAAGGISILRSWSTASLQKSIEAIGLRRAERAIPNSKKGMNVVLERMRQGGLVAVLEGMRKDSELVGTAES